MSKDSPAAGIPGHPPKKTKVSLGARLRGYFLAGILVTAPISITIYVTWGFLAFVDKKVGKFLPEGGYDALYGGTTIPGLGLMAAIVFFIVVGWFATNFLGRMIVRTSEYILHRVPVINTIYKGIKQVFETVIGAQAQAFREVVMFEFPRKGVWAMGFVTGVTKGEVQRLTEDEVVNVFFPTTPNPTSGFLLFLPKKDLIFLEMNVEDAIKMIISGGIVTPPDKLAMEAFEKSQQ
jgi:uncharacterized membrane protein